MKIQPGILLASLIALASVAGAVMYSQKMVNQSAKSPALEKKINQLERELNILKDENETLKKLQTNGAEIKLPLAQYKFVEENLGLNFPQHVKARRVYAEQMQEAVIYRYTKQFGIEGMEMREFALQQLGVLPANQNLLNQLALAETTGAVAIYDPSSNEILLSSSYDDENILHSASIIKHLTIAIIERNFPLPNDLENNLTDDEYFARQGFIRGKASSISQRYSNIISVFERGVRNPYDPKASSNAKDVFNALPILVRGITTFPTIHGKTYIEEIMLNNDSVFPAIYKNMPNKTAQIFSHQLPKKPVSTTPPELASNEYLNTELGQMFVMLYLKQLDDTNAMLYQNLNSDELSITQEQRKFTTTWKTEWDNEESAAQFCAKARELSSIPEQKPNVTISGKQVTIQNTKIYNMK